MFISSQVILETYALNLKLACKLCSLIMQLVMMAFLENLGRYCLELFTVLPYATKLPMNLACFVVDLDLRSALMLWMDLYLFGGIVATPSQKK